MGSWMTIHFSLSNLDVTSGWGILSTTARNELWRTLKSYQRRRMKATVLDRMGTLRSKRFPYRGALQQEPKTSWNPSAEAAAPSRIKLKIAPLYTVPKSYRCG